MKAKINFLKKILERSWLSSLIVKNYPLIFEKNSNVLLINILLLHYFFLFLDYSESHGRRKIKAKFQPTVH